MPDRGATYIETYLIPKAQLAQQREQEARAEAERSYQHQLAMYEMLNSRIEAQQKYLQSIEEALNTWENPALDILGSRDSDDRSDALDMYRASADAYYKAGVLSSNNADRRVRAMEQTNERFELPRAAASSLNRLEAEAGEAAGERTLTTPGAARDALDRVLRSESISRALDAAGTPEQVMVIGSEIAGRLANTDLGRAVGADTVRSIVAGKFGVSTSDIDPAVIARQKEQFRQEILSTTGASGTSIRGLRDTGEAARIAGDEAREDAEGGTAAEDATAVDELLSDPDRWARIRADLQADGFLDPRQSGLSEEDVDLYLRAKTEYEQDPRALPGPGARYLDDQYLSNLRRQQSASERLGALRQELAGMETPQPPSEEEIQHRGKELFAPDAPGPQQSPRRAAAAVREAIATAPTTRQRLIREAAARGRELAESEDFEAGQTAETIWQSIRRGETDRAELWDVAAEAAKDDGGRVEPELRNQIAAEVMGLAWRDTVAPVKESDEDKAAEDPNEVVDPKPEPEPKTREEILRTLEL